MGEGLELQRIGRYEIERILGEGAMGRVYEGKDTRLHRKVAVKTILKSALDGDSAKEYSQRFAREAQAVARLNHPNIVQVFDFAEEGDVAYIVMELVRGRELKTFFDAKERFELKESVHIMGELCDALHFAHEAGIVHRDIKPANVMIDSQGRVKLTDFGVARIADPDRTVTDKTQAGTVVGTPAYMSPEQVNGGTLDRRSDIFSAGVILYEFLCGAKPFTGGGAWAIAKKILTEEPAPPSSLNPALSPLIDAVVAKALAKVPADRYQTARQFGFALQRAYEGETDSEEVEKTVAMRAMPMSERPGQTGDVTELRTVPMPQPRIKATELEFWRSIKDGSDPADFQLYIEQFPHGIYVALAKRKIAKLQGLASGGQEQEKREIEEAAAREKEARERLEKEKADMEAALARREAEFQQREAELSQREALGPRRSKLVPVLALLFVAALGLGIWQAMKPDQAADRVAELMRLLEESKQREAELSKSREREVELAKELTQMREREEAARKAGDMARQREIAEQVKQREADAKKQADMTRQREQEAKAADLRRADAARKVDPGKVPVAVVTTTPPPAPTPAPAPAPAPVPSTPTDAPQSVEAMLARAVALEAEGKNREAKRLLEQAVREGKGQAAGQSAKRLGDMLSRGVPGVSRDYGEALRYYEIARLNGVEVQTTRAR
jgi:tRNA A-37 threonylcarbamoyl transferase component Bud32/tetratricopeptide (TPR) repeat protein